MPDISNTIMISVIICTYNRAKYLYPALECIAKNSMLPGRYELIVIDNNCNDNTCEEIKRFSSNYPEINLRYFLETNQGLSFARNRGIREALGDIVVFLDDDAFVGPDYLFTIESALNAHIEIDAFGGKIIPEFETGIIPEWLCKWSMTWVSAIDLGNDFKQFTKSYPIGANMGFRKKVLDAVGYFNTELGRNKKNLMGGEEKDLFMRMKKANYGIYYIPGIEVRHIIPPSRTTKEYIVKLGQGVGVSEKLRCKSEGRKSYLRRLAHEMIKWGGTLILWGYFAVQNRIVCGNSLILFRWNVTKKLIS